MITQRISQDERSPLTQRSAGNEGTKMVSAHSTSAGHPTRRWACDGRMPHESRVGLAFPLLLTLSLVQCEPINTASVDSPTLDGSDGTLTPDAASPAPLTTLATAPPAPVAREPAQPPQQIPAFSPDAPRVGFITRKPKGRYAGRISYPTITYPDSRLSHAVSMRVRRFAEGVERSFWSASRGDSDGTPERPTLAVSCSVSYASSALVSVGCDNFFFDGGAHGAKSYAALNLALPEMRQIGVADIVRQDPASHQQLLLLCNRALAEEAKNSPENEPAERLDETSAPIRFDTFTVTRSGLRFFFKDQLPYVIANAVTPLVTWEMLLPIRTQHGARFIVDTGLPFAEAEAPSEP